MITIKDIARAAGVSHATVSLALSGRGRATRISEQRIAEITKLAESMGYRPSAMGRAMRDGHSRIIGALIRNTGEAQFSNLPIFEILLGLNEGLETGGRFLSMVRIRDVQDEDRAPSQLFRESYLDALVALGPLPAAILPRLRNAVRRVVWCDTSVWEPANCLRRDEAAAGTLAVDLLAAAGRSRIVWVGHAHPSAADHHSAVKRLTATKAAAKARGLAFLAPDCGEFRSAIPPKLLDRTTGLVAYNVYEAHWAARRLADAGLVPGRDIGLACCDDKVDLVRTWPDLSRASFDRFAMGMRAAEMSTAKEPLPSAVLPTTRIPGTTA